MQIHHPDQFIAAIISHILRYIRSNASCKYCMDSAPISSVINMLPQLFCTSCTSGIFIWNEHIKSYMCWPCLQQLSIQFLPCLGVFNACLNAPFLGKSHTSMFIPNAKHERCEIMVRILMCTSRATYPPYPCPKYQTIPPESEDIDRGRASHLTCMSDIIRPPVLSHICQKHERHLKIAELVRPTTCSDHAYRCYPPDALT